MASLYGVAFSIDTDKVDSDFPEVIVASTEEQAVDFAKRIRAYCKWAVPFRNTERREKADWRYIKANEIVNM